MRFTIARFTKYVDPKPKGSVTLGFLDMNVQIGELEDENVIELQNLTVRLNRDGELSLAAPRRTYQTENGTRSAGSFRFSDSLYERIVTGLAQVPTIAEVIVEGQAAVAKLGVQAEVPMGAAVGDDIPF